MTDVDRVSVVHSTDCSINTAVLGSGGPLGPNTRSGSSAAPVCSTGVGEKYSSTSSAPRMQRLQTELVKYVGNKLGLISDGVGSDTNFWSLFD